MAIRLKSDIQTISEEKLVYSTMDLIVSLGGALGLFLGFSFFGYGSTLIDRISIRLASKRGKLFRK